MYFMARIYKLKYVSVLGQLWRGCRLDCEYTNALQSVSFFSTSFLITLTNLKILHIKKGKIAEKYVEKKNQLDVTECFIALCTLRKVNKLKNT